MTDKEEIQRLQAENSRLRQEFEGLNLVIQNWIDIVKSKDAELSRLKASQKGKDELVAELFHDARAFEDIDPDGHDATVRAREHARVLKEIAKRLESITLTDSAALAAEREKVLKEVAEVMAIKDWFGTKLNANDRMKALAYIRKGDFREVSGHLEEKR